MNFYEQLFCRGRTTGEGMTHFERLFAAKFGGSPPPEVREYTGAVPVTITADGTPLIDYIISGNTTQNGTPTPENPIMPQGTGERTAQLFDKSVAVNGKWLNVNTGVEENTTGIYWLSEYIPVKSGTAYSFSNSNSRRKWFYDSSKAPVNAIGSNQYTPSDDGYIRFTLTNDVIDSFMLNLGSTPLPYEPYGYKIPISSANTTTPVYLGEVETTRKVKKLVLTGAESWSLSNNRVMYTIKNTEAISYESVLCTHYISVKSFVEVYGTTNSIAVTNKAVYINSGSTDTADFKSYLAAQYAAGTPVTVWYVLATEKTAVVNEPLMRIGDYADTLSKSQAGVNIPTNNGSTTVDVDTTVKPSEVYIKYMG